MKPRAAFTLIEVLILVSLLAVVAALVTPLVKDRDSRSLAAAARMLAADLAYAQVESITHGHDPRLVIFDVANNRYRLAAVASPDAPLTHPADRLPYETRLGLGRAAHLGDVRLVDVRAGGDDRLKFDAYGRIDQSVPASIRLRYGDLAVLVTVEPTTGGVSVGQIAWHDVVASEQDAIPEDSQITFNPPVQASAQTAAIQIVSPAAQTAAAAGAGGSTSASTSNKKVAKVKKPKLK